MALNLEKKLVEDYVIEKLKGVGWNYIEVEKLNRVSFDEPLLIDDLKRKVGEINKDIELTEDDLKAVITKLQSASTDQNGHREILSFFKYGVPIKTEKERVVKYIQLFDYKNLTNNEFVFTNQFNFVGRENIRLDLILFVNGIPLVNIECKNPYTLKTDYSDAYKQIKRYEQVAPELYKYVQIGVGYAEVVKYFPIVPWLENVDQFIWKWGGYRDEDAIFFMLKPENLLDIIKNFIFMREFRGEMKKVIARYMQFRATNKIYQRVIDNLAGRTSKNKGLIWHWQGSGKTLTMIFSAHKLYFELDKPTIFFIVDRRDLERQFNEELSSLKLNFDFEKIESINHLKEVIVYDDYRGKRGVFLTLIHKFNTEESFILDELQNKGKIQERKDVICFLDEVHRNQYGSLASKMKNILSSAFFFGFTGTPISYVDRDTYRAFGYIDDKEFYLDRYFIDEAEKDGFVVPIVYELRKLEIGLKDEDIEWYIRQVGIEDISDEEEIKNISSEIERRLTEINVILENEKGIDVVCQDIAEHYKLNFDNKFKGLIVTASRKACVRFKKLLDKYLPPEYSEVVITFNPSDPREPKEINEYRNDLTSRFKINDTNEIIKKIIESFKNEEYPKLLIVTDMLITGFDEPKLGVLYLHKLVKHHKLLQTIARVNRPYRDLKKAGRVVDYVGIFKFIKEALGNYLDEDFGERSGKVIFDVNEAFKRFEELLREIKLMFGDLFGKFEKESLDEVIEILKNEDVGNKFANTYKELRKWFELLRANERMVKYLVDYKWCTIVYERYIKLINPKPDIGENLDKFFEGTLKLIHELTEVRGLMKLNPRVVDLNYVKTIQESEELTEEEKTVGTLTALHHIVYTIGDRNPIYKSIAERVIELFEKWQKNEIDISTLGVELQDILDYINAKEEERKQTELNEYEFGIKVILENKLKNNEEKLKEEAKNIFGLIKNELYPEWNRNPAKVREVSRKIREYLSDIRGVYGLNYEEFNNLHKEIFEYILNNVK
ncbi:MAG: type I restriction endonuclease [Candidatus Parcubacteria bacterium]|nr:MAG: type I restriction endonuclease [Candidatus Parcubacteria bacterium]